MKLGVAYLPPNRPNHLETDMAELASIGCDEALFAIQENHVDTLNGAIHFGPKIARKAGVTPKAVIWGFLNTFGGGRMSRIMFNDTSIWQIDEQGERLPVACINHPSLPDYSFKIARLLRDAGFEGILVDEPRVQDCFCTHCRSAFQNAFNETLDKRSSNYAEFQRNSVIGYSARTCDRMKEVDSAWETTCILMPDERQCWTHAARIPTLDTLGTDPYWLVPAANSNIEEAVGYAEAMLDVCREHGKQSQIWLNCWGIPAGREPEIYTGGKQLAEIGFDSFWTWSHGGGIGTNEACAQPELAWQSVVRLYQELSGKH